MTFGINTRNEYLVSKTMGEADVLLVAPYSPCGKTDIVTSVEADLGRQQATVVPQDHQTNVLMPTTHPRLHADIFMS